MTTSASQFSAQFCHYHVPVVIVLGFCVRWQHLGSMGNENIPSTSITHSPNSPRGGSREFIHTDAPVEFIELLAARIPRSCQTVVSYGADGKPPVKQTEEL